DRNVTGVQTCALPISFGRFRVINPTRSLVSTMMLLYSTTISLKFWSVISALVKNADDYLWINIFKVGVLPLWISVFFNDLRTHALNKVAISSHVQRHPILCRQCISQCTDGCAIQKQFCNFQRQWRSRTNL